MILEGVSRYLYCDPVYEAVRIALDYIGDKYSPGYIQGITGYAFRIAGFCPSGPTCAISMWTDGLLELLRYRYESFPLSGEGYDIDERAEQLVELVKADIDAGRPVLVWHAFTAAEWDIVCGYDEETNSFVGRGSYLGNGDDYAKASVMRPKEAVDICPAFGGLFIRERLGSPNFRELEVAALREAVKHARTTTTSPPGLNYEGIACYDAWISAFTDPMKKRELGDSYNYGVYRSVRTAAPTFLRHIASSHLAATTSLMRAADEFEAEAHELNSAEPLIWWSSPEGPDPTRNAELVPVLTRARARYVLGIELLEEALRVM